MKNIDKGAKQKFLHAEYHILVLTVPYHNSLRGALAAWEREHRGEHCSGQNYSEGLET